MISVLHSHHSQNVGRESLTTATWPITLFLKFALQEKVMRGEYPEALNPAVGDGQAYNSTTSEPLVLFSGFLTWARSAC